MATNRGLSYPLTLEDGGLKTSEDHQLIKEAIFSVLETRNGERCMRFDYGTPSYVFTSVSNPQIICEQIRIALSTQIPNVSFTVTGDINEDGLMQVKVEWQVDKIPQPPIEFKLKL